jgi:2-polyprenyl-3-methyl-5-hydroxy-6-metoxy-1,4-benzoquinol methylase
MRQYEKIAESYGSGKRMEHPTRQMVYRRWLEFCQEISDGLVEKQVCDIGSGAGDSSRFLAKAGARVFGVEPETELLKIAVAKEKEESHRIFYEIGKLPYEMPSIKDGVYDLVTGSFLLHYAESKRELFDMTKEIFRLLKPGCYFVGINIDPNHPITELGLSLVQHKISWLDKPWAEGSRIEADIYGVDGPPIKSFWWSQKTYNEAFRTAGFVDVS